MHERIREHALEAARGVKEEGRVNDLIARLAGDDRVPLGREALEKLASDPGRFVGRAEAQVDAFLGSVVAPRLAPYADLLKASGKAASRVKV